MSTCYIFTENGVKMTQKQVVKEIRNKILADPDKYQDLAGRLFSKTITTQSEIVDTLTEVNKRAKELRTNPDYQGVSSAIEGRYKLSDEPDADFELLVPEFNRKNFVENYIARKVSEGQNATEAKNEIERELDDSNLEKEMGTLFHGLMDALFKSEGDTSSQTYKNAVKEIRKQLPKTHDKDEELLDPNNAHRTLLDIVTEENPELTEDQIIEKMTEIAEDLYKKLTSNKEYEGAKIMSEFYVYTDKRHNSEYKGLKGIIDLLIIISDGSVDIIDYKVCTKPFDQWCEAKRYKTEYQLGFYRQILATHGINPSKVKLQIVPIFMNRSNAQDMNLDDKGYLRNLLIAGTGQGAYSRLHWPHGNFTSNIQYLIGGVEKITFAESQKIQGEAMESFQAMMSYNPKEKNYSKEEIIEKKLHEYKDSKGNKVYSFWDSYSRKRIVNSDREYFTKEGGVIDEYILKMKNVKNEWVKDIVEQIKEYKREEISIDDLNFLNTKNKPGQSFRNLQIIFGEYTKSQYDILDIPLLIENGILGFINTTTGTCSFIVITDQILSSSYDPDEKFGTVLGKFFTNDQVRQLNGIQNLLANCQNAELIKAVHIINCLAESNPDFFKNKTVGGIKVVNPNDGENNSIPLDDLLGNYQILCDQVGVVNHFNNEIERPDPWNELGKEIEEIINPDTDKELALIFKGVRETKTGSAYRKIQLLLDLRKKLGKRRDKYNTKDFKTDPKLNLSDPMDALFVHINELILYYQNIPIDPSGNFDKYGIHASSIVELLGLPFKYDQALIDKKGNPMRGALNGLYMTSSENSPSPTLRALNEYYEVAYSHIREQFQNQHEIITEITRPYIVRNVSSANRVLSGISTNHWEKLLVKDADGNISNTLMLRNSYTDTSLTNEDAEFLKAILWEINKYRFKNILGQYQEWTYKNNATEIEALLFGGENQQVKNLVDSQRYFELPLKRARYFQRWKKVPRTGLYTVIQKEFQTLKDDWDLTKTHATQRSKIVQNLKASATTVYNQYDLQPDDRQELIDKEGYSDFEVDLDLLALDVAFQSIRQDYFENVLQTTAAAATVLHVNQALTGVERGAEIEALAVRANSSLKDQGDVPEEWEDASKGISALRKLNSALVLAFRPLQLIKELTFGMFTNFSRAISQMNGSDKLSLKSVAKANLTIWGQSAGKWAESFSSDLDFASYTLCEWLNKTYGIANEDISRTVESSAESRFGVIANISKWMYISNSAPDYVNRLTLFVAKMMEDGCWEAHSLDKDGVLHYDFKKDSRFSELVRLGFDSDSRDETYLQQKALYLAMAEQFEKEGRPCIEYDEHGKATYKEFTRAYTNKQRNSIKEVADLAYGYYDHETKSLVDLGLFGLIYKQFQTFLTAKTNLWFKGRSITKGDNTSQGKFVPIEYEHEVDGVMIKEKCYRRLIINGGSVTVKVVPESQLEPGEKETLDYAYEWQGDYVEGLAYSVMATIRDLIHFNFDELKNNKYRRANCFLAMHDILIGIILFNIFKWLFSDGSKKISDIKPLQRILLRAMQDTSPAAVFSMDWEPGFWSTLVNLKNSSVSYFAADDPKISDFITKNIAMFRDFQYNDD